MVPPIRLDPESVICPYHGDDLTADVEAQLNDLSIPGSFAVEFRHGSARRQTTYSVPVTCPAMGRSPAAGAEPKGEAHELIVKGEL
jgi:hypothetical protein